MDQRELKEFWKLAYVASLQGHRAGEHALLDARPFTVDEMSQRATNDANRAVEALKARWGADAEKAGLQRQEEAAQLRQIQRDRGK